MAVPYSDLFASIGEFVQRVYQFTGLYSTLDTYLGEIQGDLVSANRYDVLSGVDSQFNTFKGNIQGWCDQMVFKVNQLVTHRDDVLEELNLGGFSSVQSVLAALIADMNDNSESVDASSVTIGSVTESKTNGTAGTVVTGKVLDGVSKPGLLYAANPEYVGVNSELALTSDTITIQCLTDTNNGGQEDREQWSVMGKPTTPAFHWDDRGSGPGQSITTLNSYSLLSNLDFETFTVDDTPDSWNIDYGSAGSNVYEETASVHHGDAALRFKGDGATGTIQISQTVSTGVLTPLKRYCVACFVKGQASTLAGTLTIQFEGTGYSAGSTEKIELDATALSAQTSYGLEYFFVNIPAQIPSDFELVIKVTGTLTLNKSVYIDRMAFGPVSWHNGIHFCVVGGAAKFVKGDKFTFTVTNDDAGVFQKFFRDAYGVQLPSNGSGSETIADSLAS